MNDSYSCNDDSFGPGVIGCNREFDFTLSFEESILSIAPSAILLLLGPIRILQLKGLQRRVGGRGFQFTKLVSDELDFVFHVLLSC